MEDISGYARKQVAKEELLKQLQLFYDAIQVNTHFTYSTHIQHIHSTHMAQTHTYHITQPKDINTYVSTKGWIQRGASRGRYNTVLFAQELKAILKKSSQKNQAT